MIQDVVEKRHQLHQVCKDDIKSAIEEYLGGNSCIEDKEKAIKTCLKESDHPEACQVFIETIISAHLSQDKGYLFDDTRLLSLLEMLLLDGVIGGMHVCLG